MAPRLALTEVLDAPVVDATERLVGRLEDLVVDLAGSGPSFPVTALVVRQGKGPTAEISRTALATWTPDGPVRVAAASARREPEARRPTEVFLRRDVLDAPVVLADPPRRARVSDVMLTLGPDGPGVSGLDLSAASAWRRLLRRAARPVHEVPLSQVHLVSHHGHSAQIATPGSLVFRLGARDMAEVLTRMSVARARDVVAAADERVAAEAVQLLHPHVRERVSGVERAGRRMLRLRGWRLHRPAGRPRPPVPHSGESDDG